MNTNARPRWRVHLAAAVAALGLGALAVPAHSSASGDTVDGVRAAINHGTLKVMGDDQANSVALRLKADPNRVEVDVGDDGSADFSFARGDVSAIKVNTVDGNDSVRVVDANRLFTNSITFKGGDGNDTVIGGRGDDTANLGGGDDTFVWNPGDGSDVIEGQEGSDKMLFNGAAGDEQVTLSANGGRLTFFRVQANVTMDTNDVEIVDFNALGGIDSVTVNDLTGTDVTQTNLDLAGALGGNVADGAVDNVVVNGTDGDDTIDIDGNGSGADVTGLATAVSVQHANNTDNLSVNTLAGTDNVVANGVAGVLNVLVDGVAV
jgi:RTX calcium-binding nonapeptide repeat (4 copies)